MKLISIFQKNALHIAIEKENIEIIGLLLKKNDIDINSTYILILIFNKI